MGPEKFGILKLVREKKPYWGGGGGGRTPRHSVKTSEKLWGKIKASLFGPTEA